MAQVTSIQGMGPYFVAYPCDVLASFYRNSTVLYAKYPACSSLSAHVPVEANFNLKSPETIGASMQATFGTALWLALAVHAIGVEIYVSTRPEFHTVHVYCTDDESLSSCTSRPRKPIGCATSRTSARSKLATAMRAGQDSRLIDSATRPSGGRRRRRSRRIWRTHPSHRPYMKQLLRSHDLIVVAQ